MLGAKGFESNDVIKVTSSLFPALCPVGALIATGYSSKTIHRDLGAVVDVVVDTGRALAVNAWRYPKR